MEGGNGTNKTFPSSQFLRAGTKLQASSGLGGGGGAAEGDIIDTLLKGE